MIYFSIQFSDLNCQGTKSILSESLHVSILFESHVLFLLPIKTFFQIDFKSLPYQPTKCKQTQLKPPNGIEAPRIQDKSHST